MFADNERISRRQLGAQILLGLSGIFLLALPGLPQLSGWSGILGCLLGLFFLWLYLFFLLRKTAVTRDIRERISRPLGLAVSTVLIVYLILGGGFMLRQISSMVSFRLMTSGSPWQAGVLFLAAALLGTGRKIQRRARLGEAAFLPVIIGFAALLVSCAFQIEEFDWSVMAAPTWGGVLTGAYCMFCAFSIVGVLPFLMHRVQRPQGSLPYLCGAAGTATLLTVVCLFVTQQLYGARGTQSKTFPLISLMSSANIPGDFLDRFDALWMIFLLFALLYSVGTVLFYSQYLISKNPGIWHGILAASAMFVTAFVQWRGRTAAEFYPWCVRLFFMPLFVIFGLCFGRIRRKT